MKIQNVFKIDELIISKWIKSIDKAVIKELECSTWLVIIWVPIPAI